MLEVQAGSIVSINLFAGYRPDGEAMLESIKARAINSEGWFELEHSPVFARNLARADVIVLDPKRVGFCELRSRSGNLAIRVFSRDDISDLQSKLSAKLEKLGGQLDIAQERILVYSIHVSCGFDQIEQVLNAAIDGKTSMWNYGNVYDAEDGETPLNWWNEILAPQ